MRLFNNLVLLLLALSLLLNAWFIVHHYEQSRVIRVVDGDSFDLADGRRIRLFSLDAPEKNRCGFTEARTLLSSLILGNHVRLEDIVTDDYGRQLANVFIGKTLVNESLLRAGTARFSSIASPKFDREKQAVQEAKGASRGIWGPPCRSLTPPDPACTIKANSRQGSKYYEVPGCKQYSQIIIDQSYGDQWFCSEAAAQAAGFRKAATCP